MLVQSPSTVSFDQITFGTGALPEGPIRTFLEDGLDFRLFEFSASLDSLDLSLLQLNGESILGTDLGFSIPFIGGLLDDNGVWTIIDPQPAFIGGTPGVGVMPALDFGVTAGVEISPPSLGSVNPFGFEPIFDFELPTQAGDGDTFQFGVRSVSSPYSITGSGSPNSV